MVDGTPAAYRRVKSKERAYTPVIHTPASCRRSIEPTL
jgi:hypothetical protein